MALRILSRGQVGHPAAKLMVMAVAIFADPGLNPPKIEHLRLIRLFLGNVSFPDTEDFKYFNESSRDDNGGIIGGIMSESD